MNFYTYYDFPPVIGFETSKAHFHTDRMQRWIFNACRILLYFPIIGTVGALILAVLEGRETDRKIKNLYKPIDPIEPINGSLTGEISQALRPPGRITAEKALLFATSSPSSSHQPAVSPSPLIPESRTDLSGSPMTLDKVKETLEQVSESNKANIESLQEVEQGLKKCAQLSLIANESLQQATISVQEALVCTFESGELIDEGPDNLDYMEAAQKEADKLTAHRKKMLQRRLWETLSLGFLYLPSDLFELYHTSWKQRKIQLLPTSAL